MDISFFRNCALIVIFITILFSCSSSKKTPAPAAQNTSVINVPENKAGDDRKDTKVKLEEIPASPITLTSPGTHATDVLLAASIGGVAGKMIRREMYELEGQIKAPGILTERIGEGLVIGLETGSNSGNEFSFNRDNTLPDSSSALILDEIVKGLTAFRETNVIIESFAESSNNASLRDVALKKGYAIRAYLIKAGISQQRVEVRSFRYMPRSNKVSAKKYKIRLIITANDKRKVRAKMEADAV